MHTNIGAASQVAKSRSCWQILLMIVLVVISLQNGLQAQDYFTSTGTPTFAIPQPAEMGFVDAASGDLHLEIPMGSFPQRAGRTLELKLAYDSNLWSIYNNGTSSKWVDNLNDQGFLAAGGWRLVTPGIPDLSQLTGGCTFNELYQEPNGTQHLFHVVLGTGAPSGSGGCQYSTVTTYAVDASGFQLIAQCCTNSAINFTVYAPDGTCEWGNAVTCVGDANGNYMPGAPPDTGWDTLNRQYYNSSTSSTCTFTSHSGTTYPECYYVSNSQGTTSSYTISYADVYLSTNFKQYAVTDCSNCLATIITSITLPDNTKYTFTYDCDSASGIPACNSPSGQAAYYGLLTSMTLPTGAQITYGYTNFLDSTWPLQR